MRNIFLLKSKKLPEVMETENRPTKHPRIAIAQQDTDWRNVVSNGINEEGCVQTGFGKKNGFTFMQMRELQHQSLIYKYMEAGIPVPYHLIFPIWKSMTSLTALSVIGSNTASLLSNYKNKMEAEEPGRCRRTDGKKWRCTKNVVPDHKYCQRHLHRGRTLHTSTNYLHAAASTSGHLHHQNSTTELSQ